MKVVLAHPDYSDVYAEIGEPVHEPPLGLLYLASVLEMAGHDVEVYDLVFKNQRILFKHGLEVADFLGITVTTPLFNKAIEICKMARTINPEIRIALGGPHITATRTGSYREGLMDHLVVGEGEEVITGLVEHPTDEILVYGRTVKGLDLLPFPARHRLDLGKYKLDLPSGGRGLYTTILTSRGCPYRCIYCDSHLTFGRKVRFRSPKNVFEELKQCADNYGIKHFGLLDDTTTLSKRRWMKVCDMIINDGLDISYHCATRADSVDEELLKRMKESGCYRLHIGCESGNQEILDRINKGIKLEQIKKCIKLCKKVGISTYAYFILGLPSETEDTVRETVDFVIKIDPDYFQYTIAMPFPGTELYDWVERNNLFLEDIDYEDYRWYGSPVFKENVEPERLIELQKEAYRRFYQRPGSF